MPGDANGNGATLRRLWKQWTKVVDGYGRRRAPLDPVAYGELHAKLLAACAALAAAGGAEGEFYESLTDIVRPWVSCEVLRRTDREILDHLGERCREIDCRLRGLRQPAGRTWRIAGLLVPVLLLALGAAVLALDEALALFGGRAHSLALAIWYAVRSLSMGERIVLLGIVVTALALALVRRNRHH